MRIREAEIRGIWSLGDLGILYRGIENCHLTLDAMKAAACNINHSPITNKRVVFSASIISGLVH